MKEHFPIFQENPGLIYLDNAATTHKPKCVIDAITNFYTKDYATVHRTAYRQAMKATESVYASRVSAKEFLGAKSADEIVFCSGTTEALNLVAQSFGAEVLEEGDEILISTLEHHSNIVPWQIIAKEKRAKIVWIPIDDEGELQWKGMISEKTKIIAITQMSNVTAIMPPIKEIINEAHKVGAYVVVDGAQSAAHMEINVEDLDCDFFAFSGHKTYGPTGVGVLYGKMEHLEKMQPLYGGGGMIEKVYGEYSTYQKPPLRFEAGTPNIASIIALKPALDFVMDIGRDKIQRHEDELMALSLEKLKEFEGVQVLSKGQEKGPILSLTHPQLHPLDLATLLDLDGIQVRSGHACAQPLLKRFGLESVLRVSFGIYNTKEDIDLFFKSFKEKVNRLTFIFI